MPTAIDFAISEVSKGRKVIENPGGNIGRVIFFFKGLTQHRLELRLEGSQLVLYHHRNTFPYLFSIDAKSGFPWLTFAPLTEQIEKIPLNETKDYYVRTISSHISKLSSSGLGE